MANGGGEIWPIFQENARKEGALTQAVLRREQRGSWEHEQTGTGPSFPPQSREKLEEYAGYLHIEEGSDDWYEFFDLAAAEAGRIPQDILSDKELAKRLPLVFRTIRGQKISKEKLEQLAEVIKKS